MLCVEKKHFLPQSRNCLWSFETLGLLSFLYDAPPLRIFFTAKNAKERMANGRNFLSSFETLGLFSFLYDAPPLRIFLPQRMQRDTLRNAKLKEGIVKVALRLLGFFHFYSMLLHCGFFYRKEREERRGGTQRRKQELFMEL